MSASTEAPVDNQQAGGDLHAISGIGEKTSRALVKLGIGTCAELARYLTWHTAGELAKLLADQGAQASAKRIQNQDWRGQAERQATRAATKLSAIVTEADQAAGAEHVSIDPSDFQDEVRFGVIFKREKEGRWKVTTYDERRNGPERQWGIEPTEWANWILQQMRPQLGVELESIEAGAGASYEAGVDIYGVRHLEVVRYEKLATEIQFEVSGSNRDALAADRIPYWVQVQAVDLASDAVLLLASERSRLEPEKFRYKKQLEFLTPGMGRYELQTLVLLLPPVGKMALHQGFRLRVEP